MNNYNRFIPGEEIDVAKPWSFGSVETSAALLAAQIRAREEASEQIKNETLGQQLYAQGQAQGYAQGFAEGHAQATLEGQRQITEFIAHQGQEAAQNFGSLFASAQTQLADAEQVMSHGMLELACELARQILRHELSVDPDDLLVVVREAIGLLVSDSKSVLIRLNPLDLGVLEGVMRTEFADLSLNLVADAAITKGGCLVESAGTVVDATLEKRWMRAIANLGLSFPWETPVEQP